MSTTLPPPPATTLLDALQYQRLVASICERHELLAPAGSDERAELRETIERAGALAHTIRAILERGTR